MVGPRAAEAADRTSLSGLHPARSADRGERPSSSPVEPEGWPLPSPSQAEGEPEQGEAEDRVEAAHPGRPSAQP